MKQQILKKAAALTLSAAMMASAMAPAALADETAGGTILWLSNLSSGPAYEAGINYMTALCDELGYEFTVVYGDMYNDPAGNLAAVRNGMTDDVVGIVASQDGGLSSIMEEFPELYVAGYNSDMTGVYGEDGASADVLENDHFLGTIVDGHADGTLMAQLYFDILVEKGYKKIAVINFPSYAYPNQGVANDALLSLIDEYNADAEEPIEVVGETTTLEFQTLEDSWFLEDGHDDLDCIVSLCAGITFVYPTLISAKGNGTCAMTTRMITGGFENDASILADCGDEGTITALSCSPIEDAAFPILLLDRAIRGEMYEDWTNDRVDATDWLMDSTEDFEKVTDHSIYVTYDVADAQLSVEDAIAIGSYSELVSTLQSISVDDL